MFSKNPKMLAGGYAPASGVARALSLALSTIHRMVEDGRVDGTRIGRALYLKLDSLETYFEGENNTVMKDAIVELRKSIAREVAEAEQKTGTDA